MSLILRMTLDGIDPPITRTLRMPGHRRLNHLHKAIQVLMGWKDYHLHDFGIGRRKYGDLETFEPWDEDDELLDERDFRLDTLRLRTHFVYRYDYGDGWEVHIVVTGQDDDETVECLDGRRAGPPEDCGGVSGYDDLVLALSDEEHPEHDELRTWAGRWDAEKFDLADVNRKLSRMFPGGRKPATVPQKRIEYTPDQGTPTLEHYQLQKLNTRQRMMVALRQFGPCTPEVLAEHIESYGVEVPHGPQSLLRAWKRQPPIRQKADGRLELDVEHPAWREEQGFIDIYLTRPEPPRAEPVAIDTATPLTQDELARVSWLHSWNLRRRFMMCLDACGEATVQDLVAMLASLGQPVHGQVTHSSYARSAFINEDGRLRLRQDDPGVVKMRLEVRKQLAATPPTFDQTAWEARQQEAARRRAAERDWFKQATRCLVQEAGDHVWLLYLATSEQRRLDGTDAVRAALPQYAVVVGLDPKGLFERLDIPTEGHRFVDITPPFRSQTIEGRQTPVALSDAVAMTIAWPARSDLDRLYQYYRYGVTHGAVKTSDAFVQVHWNIGHEPTINDVLSWAAREGTEVEVAVGRPDRLRRLLPREVPSFGPWGGVTGLWADGTPANLRIMAITQVVTPPGFTPES